MINCRRPSNKSSRLALPLGPSNSYFLSTATHGIRRRSAASASRERVRDFSFTRSCWRAASHSGCDTIGGGFMARCSFPCSLSLSLLVAILFLRCFLRQTETIRSEQCSELADAHRQNSSRGSGSGDHDCCACDTCWAHQDRAPRRVAASFREVAKHGIAPGSGPGDRGFKSRLPDHSRLVGPTVDQLVATITTKPPQNWSGSLDPRRHGFRRIARRIK